MGLIERKDAVGVTTTSTGTGAVTLGTSALAGHQNFTAHATGAWVRYRIEDSTGAEWEVGLGVYTSSGPSLSRLVVYESSNSDALVNFSAGTKIVRTLPTAADFYPRAPLLTQGGMSFNGTTQYLDGNALTGVVDGKLGSLFAVVRFANVASASERIWHSSGDAFQILRNSAGTLQISAEDTGAATTLNILSATGACSAAGTYIIMASWNLASAGSGRMWINEASNYVESAYIDANIDYTVAENSVGGSVSGGTLLGGDIYTIWIDFTQRLEWNTESVRRKFIDADGNPVFLGTAGQLPTGTAPGIFLGYDDSSCWNHNRGSLGGSFVKNNAPGDVGTVLLGQSYTLEQIHRFITVTADHTIGRTETGIINNKSGSALSLVATVGIFPGRRLDLKTIQTQAINASTSIVVPKAGGAAGTAIVSNTAGNWASLTGKSDTTWEIVAGT